MFCRIDIAAAADKSEADTVIKSEIFDVVKISDLTKIITDYLDDFSWQSDDLTKCGHFHFTFDELPATVDFHPCQCSRGFLTSVEEHYRGSCRSAYYYNTLSDLTLRIRLGKVVNEKDRICEIVTHTFVREIPYSRLEFHLEDSPEVDLEDVLDVDSVKYKMSLRLKIRPVDSQNCEIIQCAPYNGLARVYVARSERCFVLKRL